MIECIFTLDYEIYGNGQGSLRDLVVEPTRQLQDSFRRAGVPFVNFVEPLEFEQIELHGADRDSPDVRRQIRDLHEEGHEIALHLHPQWANAQYRNGAWDLDYSEYNLCTLPAGRIQQIVDRAIAWLRSVLSDPTYTPRSFRAGNWLFQPTHEAARVLAARGVRVDSSVFKGGYLSGHRLDYRPAMRNGWHWRFSEDVNVARADGQMLECPIYSRMIPSWQMLTAKRVGLQRKVPRTKGKGAPSSGRLQRALDYLRLFYPLKFDFCRMSFRELTSMVEPVIEADSNSPSTLKPMVAIGHSKDLVDVETISRFLDWLKQHQVEVSTLKSVSSRC